MSKRDPRVVSIYSRHYSALKNGKTRADWIRYGITPPGESITLLTYDCSALFVWMRQRYIRADQAGIYCSVFRNEGSILSSDLIIEAEEIALSRWAIGRFYTYIDDRLVKSSNPGYCFKLAGWNNARDEGGKILRSSLGLIILEKVKAPADSSITELKTI